MRAARSAGARMLCFGDENYPRLLMTIPDPPPMLWVIGDEALLRRQSVAVIGARNASSLGLRTARKFAQDLGDAGQIVVSGMARGVDAAAHEATLLSGTVAVLPGGVDVIYPAQNADLGRKIKKQGVLISEAPMGHPPQARDFLRRNRIITGLSRAVLVVEAALKSGTMNAAEQALEQGREIFAVPGHPFDRAATGTNILIRDGATLARYAGDILEVLSDLCFDADEDHPAPNLTQNNQSHPADPPAKQPPVQSAPPTPSLIQKSLLGDLPTPGTQQRSSADIALLHQDILVRLDATPLSQDDLVRALNINPQDLAAEIVALELDGLVARDLTGRLTRLN